MKQGDIIEIVQHDENAQMNLRRVQVKSLSRSESFYRIVGVNLRGKYPQDYRLPIEPLPEIVKEPCSIGWMPFDVVEGEE